MDGVQANAITLKDIGVLFDRYLGWDICASFTIQIYW